MSSRSPHTRKPVLSTFTMIAVMFLCTELVGSVNLNGTKKVSNPADQPPLVFPEDNTKYKIIPNNSSIINSLTHVNKNKNSTSDSEIYDLQANAPQSDEILKETNNNRETSDLSVLKLEKNPKLENEQLQPIGAFVQKDEKLESDQNESHTGVWTVVALAAILATAGLAYAATLLWPKIQTLKYGRRQILRNEDDSPIPEL